MADLRPSRDFFCQRVLRTQRLCDVLTGHLLQYVTRMRYRVHRLETRITEEELLCVWLSAKMPTWSLLFLPSPRLTNLSASLKLNCLMFLISSAYRAGRKILTPTSVAIWYGRENCKKGGVNFESLARSPPWYIGVPPYFLDCFCDELSSLLRIPAPGLLDPHPALLIDAESRDATCTC